MKEEFYVNAIGDKVCAILLWTVIGGVLALGAFCLIISNSQ